VIMKKVGVLNVVDGNGVKWWDIVQLSFWVVGGMSLIILMVADWQRQKTPANRTNPSSRS